MNRSVSKQDNATLNSLKTEDDKSNLNPTATSLSPQKNSAALLLCESCQTIGLPDYVENMPSQSSKLTIVWKPTDERFSEPCHLCGVFREMSGLQAVHHAAVSQKRLLKFHVESQADFFWTIKPKASDSAVVLFLDRVDNNTGPYSNMCLISIGIDDDRIRGRITSPELVDFNIINHQISYCQDHHKLCFMEGLEFDLQVVDCRSGLITDLPKKESYIALSYVWGSIVNTSLGQGLENQNIWEVAPKTITNAMTVAVKLNINYLWVDEYCIPRADEHKKRFLIDRMGYIYAQATLTVIAAAGVDPSYGLPGVSTTPRTRKSYVKFGGKEFAVCRNVKKEVESSKWNSRGWTFQEALLSRRRLVFTDTQFYFQCRERHFPETLCVPPHKMQDRPGPKFLEVLNLWRVFPNSGVGDNFKSSLARIGEYVRRHLTLESDALNAFQGIIEEFQSSKQPVRFFTGIPLPHAEYVSSYKRNEDKAMAQLVFGLTWRYESHNWTSSKDTYRRKDFPSWSWVGWGISISCSKINISHFEMKSTEIRDLEAVLRAFSYHVAISVELPNEEIIVWNDAEAIQSRFDEDSIPRRLHITGWTFNLQIIRTERIYYLEVV
jgi:heterokaryon incompatibility protein (HET)